MFIYKCYYLLERWFLMK